jgi:predicted dithiol-disulfide oxidoreductase (DUF899 family)
VAGPHIAGRAEWLPARLALLAREKELNRLRDELAAERRALPWVRIDADYRFQTPDGEKTLAQLFDGKSQLIVYHFMLGADAADPCKSCSFWAEQYDAARVHLPHRDVNLIAVSLAPLAKIEAVRKRMGWRFPWVSSAGSSFNADFGVTFTEGDAGKPLYNFATQAARPGESPGLSVFVKDPDGAVFHTYSTYARGLDPLNATYQLLDLTPKGRDEAGLPWPMAWLQLKDAYPS